jgi:hypothetical protein
MGCDYAQGLSLREAAAAEGIPAWAQDWRRNCG